MPSGPSPPTQQGFTEVWGKGFWALLCSGGIARLCKV